MHVVASDITDRSTHFARFNSLLNGCTNIQVVKGDLFNAVDGRSFDRIVTHPPYMPTLEEARIWRDGGPIGDAILRRIIEQLPIYLRSGGTYVCFGLGIDSQTQRFEDKIRSWVGIIRITSMSSLPQSATCLPKSLRGSCWNGNVASASV